MCSDRDPATTISNLDDDSPAAAAVTERLATVWHCVDVTMSSNHLKISYDVPVLLLELRPSSPVMSVQEDRGERVRRKKEEEKSERTSSDVEQFPG